MTTIDKDILKVELFKSLMALPDGANIPQEGQITEDEFNQLFSIFPFANPIKRKITYNSNGTITVTHYTE